MRSILTIVLVMVAAGPAEAMLPLILWDQPAADGPAAGLADAVAGCGSGTETVHQASDIRLDCPATITRITTCYAATASASFAAVAEAWLWIAPQDSRSPAIPAGAPRRDGRLVRVFTRRRGDRFDLVADALDIPLPAGRYWISLTPVVPVGTAVPARHLFARDRFGEPPLAWCPCAEALPAWRPAGAERDLALLIEGKATPPAAAGVDDAPWRNLR